MKVEFKVKIDYDKYGGKYIAIADDAIITSGKNVRDVWEEAKRRHPNKKISLMKVPEPEMLVLMICK